MNNATVIRFEDQTSTIHETEHPDAPLDHRFQVIKSDCGDEYHKLLSYSTDVVLIINEHDEFEQVSNPAFSLWGFEPEQMINKKFSDYIFAEDRKATVCAVAEVRQGMNITMFQNRFIHKNGRHVPMLWSARWDRIENKIYCTGRNAAEKIELKNAIIKAHERFSEIFYKAPAAICVLKGKEHCFEMANSLYYKMAGKKSIIGKNIRNVFPEMESQGYFELLDNVYATGKSYFSKEKQVVLQNEDGRLTENYLDFIYQAYYDVKGDVEGIFFFGHDVTEQVVSRKKILENENKNAELMQTLAESEKSYRQIVQTAQEGIWKIDCNSRTTFVNKKMCEILEYTEAEMLGRTNISFKNVEEQEKALQQIERRKKGVVETHESTFITKCGKQIWTQVTTNPILTENGVYDGALAMMTDITEKKLLQQELLNQQIEKQKAIIKAAVNAQEKERRDIGLELHDNVNQILAASRLYLNHSLTQEDNYKPFVIKTQEYISQAIEEIRKLTKALVGPAKEETMGLAVSIMELTCNISMVKKINFKFEHINYAEEFSDPGLKVVVYRIIQEQINNIIKHADASEVIIDLANRPPGLRLTIKDNGKGFDTLAPCRIGG